MGKVKLKINRNLIGYQLCLFGSFVFSYYVRAIALPNTVVAVNFIAIFGVFCIFLRYGKQFTSRIQPTLYVLSIILLSFLYFITETVNHFSIMYAVKCWFALIAPLFLISVELTETNTKIIISLFLKVFNVLVGLMFGMLIIDVIFNNVAMQLFASIVGDVQLFSLAKSTMRHCSIIGHYIPTAQIYVFYYIFNQIVYKIKLQKTNIVIVTFIALIGVGATASKTNILALLILLILFNIASFKSTLGMIIVLILAYGSGAFDSVISRFITTELTTGRDSTWVYILANVKQLFPIFIGHGTSSVFTLNETSGISWASAAFEYPYRALSYEFGIVFTAIFFMVAFVIPLVILFKRKNYQMCILLAMIILIINLYNGITCYMDFFWQYSIYVFVLLNISKYFNTRRVFKYRIDETKKIKETGDVG